MQAPFHITPAEGVVTAGSCFARHIFRYLQANGFSYRVTEGGHPLLSPATKKQYNYGAFTARYGSIYTTRQMVQLLHRIYGVLSGQTSSLMTLQPGWNSKLIESSISRL